METSILTSKGQLLIPKRLRDKYGIEPGTKVVFEETEGGVLVKPMNEQFFKQYLGILESDGNLIEEMKQHKQEEKLLEEKERVVSTSTKVRK